MLDASGTRRALTVETEPEGGPLLADLVERLDLTVLDPVLVEWFKHESLAKIEQHRPVLGQPLLASLDPGIIAVATGRLSVEFLDPNDPGEVVEVVLGWVAFGQRTACEGPSAVGDVGRS